MVRNPTKPSEGTNHARQILPQTSSFISPHLPFKKIPRKENPTFGQFLPLFVLQQLLFVLFCLYFMSIKALANQVKNEK